jgi:hypothetical protein
MRFEDFILQLDASVRGGYRARVLKSPFGEAAVTFSLSVPPSPAVAVSAGAGNHRGLHLGARDVRPERVGEEPAIEAGGRLFREVFQGQLRTLLDKSLGQLEKSPDLGLRFKIKLDPGDEEIGALADLPWELLCDTRTEEFFALSRRTSVVRYLDVPRPSQPIPFTPLTNTSPPLISTMEPFHFRLRKNMVMRSAALLAHARTA